MPEPQPSLFKRWQHRLHHVFVGSQRPERASELSALQQFIHFWLLAGQSFVKNRLPVRAASLSYTTILALIPMLAVVVGITSSLLKGESNERIEQFVDTLVENLVPPAVTEEAVATSATNAAAVIGHAEAQGGDDEPVGFAAVDSDPTNAPAAATGSGGVRTNAPVVKRAVLSEDAQESVARKINEFINNTRSGTLGTVGTLVLIFMAISMLIRIEDAFNDMWGVVKGRPLFMRLVLYWTVISLAPVLLVVAMGLANGPHLESAERLIRGLPLIGWLLYQLLPVLSVLVLCVAFGVFYMLMPNTRVQWRAALMGGMVAAVLWLLNNWLSALYVTRVATNSKIYGGLGLVPVFMIGLYFAWMILLFGGQVSYAWQNRLSYFQERIVENINQRGREFVALRLMTAIGAAYQRGAPPPTHAQLSESLEIPPRLSLRVLQALGAASLITEVSGADLAYVPARPIESISCYDILHALRCGQGDDLAAQDEPVHRQIFGEFQRINMAERNAAESISVLALAQRANQLAGEGDSTHHTLPAGNSAAT
ncbi:MAG: YihY family inner membrane protein [Verrucomicrobia bacterium]|nr:YihY family inner membrane protein [Verrucomicrobiota bacterium]